MRTSVLFIIAAIVLAGCTGDDDPPSPTSSTTSAEPTATSSPSTTTSPIGDDVPGSAATTATEGSGLSSSVDTSTSNVQSSVEVRVADIISEFDGETTTTGTALTIPGQVLFDTDKDTLRPEAVTELDKIVEVLTFYEDAPVEIVGHTDSRASDAHNQDLSERRAEAVAAYLRDADVDDSRLTVEGKGEAEPVADNDTAEGRQRNRRVVVTVIGVQPPDAE